jgi:hypothetical protein
VGFYFSVDLVAGRAVINATGVYAQLVSAHVGDRWLGFKTQDAAVAAHIIADLDRRLA